MSHFSKIHLDRLVVLLIVFFTFINFLAGCARCQARECHEEMVQAAKAVSVAKEGSFTYYSNSFHLSAPSRREACLLLASERKNYGPACQVEWK